MQTRNDGHAGLSDRLEHLASKLDGMGMGQLPPGNLNNLLRALDRPVRGGAPKTLGFQRGVATGGLTDRSRHSSDGARRTSIVQHAQARTSIVQHVQARTSVVQYANGHTGHLSGHPSATNLHAPGKPRTSTASLAGCTNEDFAAGGSPGATVGLPAISEAHGAAAGPGFADGDGSAPPSARRRASAASTSKAHQGLAITRRPQLGSTGVSRDEPAKEFSSYTEMTVESKQLIADAVKKYTLTKVEAAAAVRKIQSDKREAFAAIDKERKQTLNGGAGRRRIHKQANSLEAATHSEEAHRKKDLKPQATQAASLTYVEHRHNRTGSAGGRTPKRPDSVDLAAQLLLGHSGDKPLNGDLSYDEDALHRAQELIQAAEMDRKSTGGGGVIGP